MLKKIISSVFSSSKRETSVLDIADRLTSSDSSLERKHPLALMQRVSKARLFLVCTSVPCVFVLIRTLLVCEAFGIEFSDNFYSIIKQLMYILGLIYGFYFYASR